MRNLQQKHMSRRRLSLVLYETKSYSILKKDLVLRLFLLHNPRLYPKATKLDLQVYWGRNMVNSPYNLFCDTQCTSILHLSAAHSNYTEYFVCLSSEIRDKGYIKLDSKNTHFEYNILNLLPMCVMKMRPETRLFILSKVIDKAQRTSKLKWLWVFHVCRRINNRWSKRVLEWSTRLGKPSESLPPARWSDADWPA